MVALAGVIALAALPGAAGADHAGEFLNGVRGRFQALQASLENVAARAATGELDAALAVLEEARSAFETSRDDLGDLAPQGSQLLRAFFDGMVEAADEGNADDLTALARSAAATVDDVLARFDAYAAVGTTVEVESGELNPGETTTLALFVRDVPAGFAGYEVVVRFDPEQVRIDEASLQTGRGATRIDNDDGTVSFSGVAVEVAAQRVPPEVLALGTFRITAVGTSGTESTLTTEIRELVDLDGNRVPALDLDGTVTIR